MVLFPLLVVACSLSAVLCLHILPCEPGMAGELGCDSFFSRQGRSSRTFAVEPEFRDRGLGDRGFGERFGGINSDQFFDGGSQDQFFDGGNQDQFLVGGQGQFVGGGVQDQFLSGSGGTFVSGGFESDLGGVVDSSFGNDQGLFLDSSAGLSNIRGGMGSLGLQNFGSQGLGISSRFGKGKSRGISSSVSYPKGFGVSRKGRGSSFPSKGISGRTSSGMLGFGRQRGYPKFQNSIIGMNRGLSRSSLSYPKGGSRMSGWNKGGLNNGGIGGWRGKGMSNSLGMGRSFSKGIGRGRMSSRGSWGQGMAYPKGISRSSFSSKRSSGGY